MAINPGDLYPGKTKAPDTDYPYGSARNVTTPGDGTGTPWEAALVNDIFGFQQAILDAAGVVPTGTPDRVGASQYLQALIDIIGAANQVDTVTGEQALAVALDFRAVSLQDRNEDFAGLAPTIEGQKFLVQNAVYSWDSTALKDDHNGTTIISPTVPALSAQANLWAFRNGIGETDPGGTGAFILDTADTVGRIVSQYSTNIVPNPVFRGGLNNWGQGGNTNPEVYVWGEYFEAGGGSQGLRISVNDVTAVQTVANASPLNVDSTKKYRLRVRGSLNQAPGAGEQAQIIVSEGRFNASYAQVYSHDVTAAGDFVHEVTINENGGGAPAWLNSDSSQVLVQFRVQGAAGGGEVRFRINSVSLIPDEECFAPVGVTADGDQSGTHEGVRVDDDIFLVLHGYRRVVKFDKELKRQAVSPALTERPHDITYDGSSVWCITQGGQSVHELDPSSLAILNTYAIIGTGGREGFGITYDPSNDTLYLGAGSESAGEISVVIAMDPADGSQTILTSDVAGTGNNIPVEVFAGSVWSNDGNTNTVKRINKSTGATEASIPVGSVVGKVYGLGTNGRVLCVCGAFGVAQIDPGTNTVLRSWTTPQFFGAANVYIDDFGIAYASALAMDTNTGESWPIVADRFYDGNWKWVHQVTDTKFVYGGINPNWLGSFTVSSY